MKPVDCDPPRNVWVRCSEGDWPLVQDLGRDIGSAAWWRGLLKLCAGLAAAVVLGIAFMVQAGREVDIDASAATAPERPPPGGLSLSSITYTVPLPPLAAEAVEAVASAAGTVATAATQIVVGRGDTLIDVLVRAGAARLEAHRAVAALSELFDPRRLRVGQAIELDLIPGGEGLRRVALRAGIDEMVVAEATDDGGFHAAREPLATTAVLSYAAGIIDDSLYLAAEREGVPARVIVELIRLYSFDVDFQREMRAGDRFELLYERTVAQSDGLYEDGDILYARLVLRGRELPLYRYRTPDDERIDYFDAEGESVRKALMKTPLDGARLTSRFGKRRHPVLGYVRAHRGLDFGAPTGTPVYAAGDGVVERASRWGAYGNYIRIRHNSTSYKTAYAHLSRYARGIRAGKRVRQGEVIGHVGATGRVTGPHLHYEVLVGDEQVDPLSLDLPSGRTLDGPVREAFLDRRRRLDADRGTLAHARTLAHAATGP